MTSSCLPDRVHPSATDHLIMTEALLKYWHAPALVTAVSIDASGERVGHADNTGISDFGSRIALGTNGWRLAAATGHERRSFGFGGPVFGRNLEQETLQITGLAGRQYLLIIDDQQIGTFNEAQLGEGINLAVLTTPMAKQAATGACFDAKAQQRPRGPLAPRSSGSRGRCAGAQRRGAEESGHVGERTNPAAA